MEASDNRVLLKRALLKLDELQAKLDRLHEPIAIVGLSCRFPAGANDPEALWQILRDGIDAIREIPPDRWDVDAYYDSNPGIPGKMYTRCGGFLDSVDRFDPHFFGISPREVLKMDPQQRLLLEVAWEALERAGQAPSGLAGSRTGVFVGISGTDYAQLQTASGDPEIIDTYFGAGAAHSIASGRISYLLGLQGPSVSVDTACSSSLLAVHLACQSLQLGECDMALAGGVNLILSPNGMIAACQTRMLSPDGRCKTFDAGADGYVRAEGCAVVVLKRLSKAKVNGDNILAVIRGTAANQDGHSNGLTAPNGSAQEAVIREALANSGVKAAEVSYLETHGTGTSLGDPIEVQALGAVLGQDRPHEAPVLIGAVKSNIGHLEAAAGIAGLVKVILALQYKQLPPSLHVKKLNPHIDWEHLPVKVVGELAPWPAANGKRIAGISSFGFSGTNVHVIVEEAPAPSIVPANIDRPLHVLGLSAKTEAAVKEFAGCFTRCIAAHSTLSLADICFTANTGRSHFNHRLAVIGTTTWALSESLAAFAAGQEVPTLISGSVDDVQPQVAFLFTGQGAQYVNMGKQLFETERVFRQAMERCEEILRSLLDRSLLSIIYPAANSAAEAQPLIDQTQYTQPALFAIEYALAQLWQSWGVIPAAVMGHSVGEYVAACIAGVLSLDDALKLIAARGRLMGELPTGGMMAAVFADEVQVQAAIASYRDRVSIAAINGPKNVVISGAGAAVTAVIDHCAALGIASQQLTVSHGFHSPLMEPMLSALADVAASVTFTKSQIDFVSNVTGAIAGTEMLTPAYWRDHARKPVRFADGIKTMTESGYRLFLECGPKPTLCAMGQRCLPDGTATWLPSLRPENSDVEQILRSLGQLYTRGVSVDWQSFHGAGHRRVVLPTYPFQRRRYWVEPLKQWRAVPALHPLIHERLSSPLIQETVFSSYLATDAPAYLNDHRVFNLPLFPGTGFLELMLAASNLAFGKDQMALASVEIQEALVLPENSERLVQVAVSPPQDGQVTVRVFSQNDNESWKQYATAVVKVGALSTGDVEPLDSLERRCTEEVKASAYYERLADIGLAYGPSFRGIQAIRRREGEAFAHVKLPEGVSAGGYFLHPALLDACFQVIGVTLPESMDSASDPSMCRWPFPAFRSSVRVLPVCTVTRFWKQAATKQRSCAEVSFV